MRPTTTTSPSKKYRLLDLLFIGLLVLLPFFAISFPVVSRFSELFADDHISTKTTSKHQQKDKHTSSSSMVESSSSSAKQHHFSPQLYQFCRDPRNCYRAECYAPLDYFGGGCLPNPYFIPPQPKKFERFSISVSSNTTTNSRETRWPNLELNCEDGGFVNRRRKNVKFSYLLNNSLPYEGFVFPSTSTTSENPSSTTTPPPPLSEIELDQKHAANLFKFKKHTSFMFNKWFNWSGGKCQRPTTPESWKYFYMKGEHDRNSDGLFTLHNVCLRPKGKFAGYSPIMKFERYRGVDDVFHATHVGEEGFEDFISNYDVMKRPADCYLDANVILFPVSKRINNPGHCYQRCGSMLRVIENLFGTDAMMQQNKKSEVIIGYVATKHGEPSADSKRNLVYQNKMDQFYEILGNAWFSIYSQNWTNNHYDFDSRKEHVEDPIYGFRTKDEDLSDTLMCFKKVTLWANAIIPDKRANEYGFSTSGISKSATADKTVIGAASSFHLHGPRSQRDAETLKILDSRLRSCFKNDKSFPAKRARSVADLVKENKGTINVLFAVRSSRRRFTLQPYIVDHLAKHFFPRFIGGHRVQHQLNVSNFNLQVVEHSKYSMKEIISFYSKASIVIGIYGASLMHSVYAPPGAVTVEFSFHRFRFSPDTGINKNPNSEYGGNAQIAQQYHFAIADHKRLQRFVHGFPDALLAPGFTDINPYFPFFDWVAETTKCLVTQHVDVISQALYREIPPAVPRHCEVTPNQYEQFVEVQSSWQAYTDIIKRVASTRLFPKSSPYYSPRLHMMLKHSEVLAHVWKPHLDPNPYEHPTTVIILEPCAARAQIYAEISAIRQLVSRIDSVTVVEYVAGRFFCERMRENFEKFNISMFRNRIERHPATGAAKQNDGKSVWKEGAIDDYLVPRPDIGLPKSQIWFCEFENCKSLMADANKARKYDMIFHDCYDEHHCRMLGDEARKTRGNVGGLGLLGRKGFFRGLKDKQEWLEQRDQRWAKTAKDALSSKRDTMIALMTEMPTTSDILDDFGIPPTTVVAVNASVGLELERESSSSSDDVDEVLNGDLWASDQGRRAGMSSKEFLEEVHGVQRKMEEKDRLDKILEGKAKKDFNDAVDADAKKTLSPEEMASFAKVEKVRIRR